MRVVEVPKDLDKEAFAKKAQAIYDQKHREQMEATARGKVVAIEVESCETSKTESFKLAHALA